MKKTKILYLHGLDSHLTEEKRRILEKHFEVVAPQINYRENTTLFQELSDKLTADKNIQAVIGSSMGGCFSYYLSLYHTLPGLLFNPALVYTSIEINLPKLKDNSNLLTFIIGGKDTVVPAKENRTWVESINTNTNYILKWYNQLEHRIDLDTFKTEVDAFALLLNKKSK